MASTNSQLNSMESILKSLSDDYLADLPDRINEMEYQILALEDEFEFESAYHELYRNVHSIKGSAGTHGFHIITRICHCFEDNLTLKNNTISKFTVKENSILLGFLDLISNARSQLIEGNDSFGEIEHELDKIKVQVSNNVFKILIIEQSKATMQLIISILSEYPVQIVTFSDGLRSLEKLIYDKYDLVFAAVELPVLNGLALTSAIRLSQSMNSNIPIVLLSSKDNVDNFEFCEANLLIHRNVDMSSNIQKAVSEFLNFV